MASRVMPLRALVGVSALTIALGMALVAPTQAAVPTASSATATTVTLVRGEPIASRNRAVTYSVRGVRPSAYIGSFYDSRSESRRKCIVKRESNGVYDVRSGNGYFGAYQMTRGLAKGATYRMYATLAHEVGKTAALAITAHLRAVGANHWSRYWQDRAFWTIWNHGKGAGNWAGGSHSC
jgi:Transglycosylase-like domain